MFFEGGHDFKQLKPLVTIFLASLYEYIQTCFPVSSKLYGDQIREHKNEIYSFGKLSTTLCSQIAKALTLKMV